MNARSFGILAIVAALLAVLAIVAQHGSDRESIAGATAGSKLLPDVATTIDGLREIDIEGAGDQRLVTLEATDGEWHVAEQDGYPAAVAKVNALLIDLAEASIVEEKTSNPEFYSRLGVEPVDGADATGVGIALVGGDGSRVDLVLGEAYGTGQRYARRSSSALSVLIDRNPDIARDPADWVAPEIIALPGSRVRRVEINHADGERVVLSKSGPQQTDFTVENVPEGRELQYATIGNVTGNVLQKLNLESVSRASPTPAEPIAVSEFRTFDGLIVTVEARAADEGDPWLAFRARYDADEAIATDSVAADGSNAEAAAGEPAPASTDSAQGDVAAEAQAINARLGGWRYRIASYQYSQLTRHMSDLLRALPASDE